MYYFNAGHKTPKTIPVGYDIHDPNLHEYLRNKRSKDKFYFTDEYLDDRDNAYYEYLYEWILPDGTIEFDPTDIVIRENESRDLKDQNGRVIKSWR